MSCVDLHVHLLPGVDDGPESLEETVAMLRVAWASGTRTVVATPHLYTEQFPELTAERLRKAFWETVERLRELLGEEATAFLGDMKLQLGAEHRLSPRFLSDLETGDVLPIGDSRYLLVEFPTNLPRDSMTAAARRILSAGYVPLLAHVERYRTVQRDPEGLAELLDLGCVAQLNLGNPTRTGDGRRWKLRRRLLDRGLAQVVATDAHDAEIRAPRLGRAGELLGNGFSPDQLAAWTRENPTDILHDKPLRRGWIRS